MATKNTVPAPPHLDVHQVNMGLGDAIQRLVQLEFRYRQGISQLPETDIQERNMLLGALNQFELNLGFDCNIESAPNNVSIFEQSAATSCCRILPFDTSRNAHAPKPPPVQKAAVRVATPPLSKREPSKKNPRVKANPTPQPSPPEPVAKKVAKPRPSSRPARTTKSKKSLGSIFKRGTKR